MMEISELEGKKRVVIFWEGEVGKGEPVFLVTNWWHRERVVALYQGRWGEETLHRDLAAALGTGGLPDAQNQWHQAAFVLGDERI
jgi:hypothetical protein